MPKRHELTDAQWAKVEGLLPGKKSDSGRTAADNRLFVSAVAYVLTTGIPRADLPARFGKPDTVRKRFGRWCAAGVWARVVAASAAGDADPDEVQLDSTSVKAHPVAATGRRRPREKPTTSTPGGAWAGAGAG